LASIVSKAFPSDLLFIEINFLHFSFFAVKTNRAPAYRASSLISLMPSQGENAFQ
jgi:hypothetical protein